MSPKTAVMAAVAASLLVLVASCAHRAVPTTQPALGVGTASATPSACPATLPEHYPYPAASKISTVPGVPDRATVCRYGGLNDPHPRGLVRSATIGAGPAAQLARALNRGKPFPVGVAYQCPADLGLTDLVLFGFPDSHPVAVQLDMTGCRTAANGERVVFYPIGVSAQVTSLVGR